MGKITIKFIRFAQPTILSMLAFLVMGASQCSSTQETALLQAQIRAPSTGIASPSPRPSLVGGCLPRGCAVFLPPSGCTYSPPPVENGCEIGCGKLSCGENSGCHPISCPQPPQGFEYQDPTYENGCATDCGHLVRKIPNCPLIDCAAPPSGCQYVRAIDLGDPLACSTGCGTLKCNSAGTL